MRHHRAGIVRIVSTVGLAACLLVVGARAATDVYPGASWDRVEALEEAGWSRAGLDEARQ